MVNTRFRFLSSILFELSETSTKRMLLKNLNRVLTMFRSIATILRKFYVPIRNAECNSRCFVYLTFERKTGCLKCL